MSAAAALHGSGNWTAYLDFGLAVAVGRVGRGGRPGGDRGRHRRGRARALRAGPAGPAGGPLAAVGCRHRGADHAGRLRRAGGRAVPRRVQHLLDGALAPFRNIYKFEPIRAFGLALGLAHGLARLREITPVRLPVLRFGSAVLAIAVLVGSRAAVRDGPGAAAGCVPGRAVVLAGRRELPRPQLADRAGHGGAGRLARRLHVGHAGGRAAGAAGDLAVGAARPGAVLQRRCDEHADGGRAGHGVRTGGARPGDLPGARRHPLRRGAQRSRPDPTGIHVPIDDPRDAGRVGLPPRRLVRAGHDRRLHLPEHAAERAGPVQQLPVGGGVRAEHAGVGEPGGHGGDEPDRDGRR